MKALRLFSSSAILFLFALFGCGQLNRGVDLSIYSAKGTISSATVSIYSVTSSGARGSLLGTTSLNAAAGSLLLAPFDGPVEFVVSGGTYYDEATGDTVDMDDFSMRSRLADLSASRNVMISALTEMAVQRSLVLTGTVTENIAAANQAVATAVGVTDITKVTSDPTLRSSNTVTGDDATYGMVLAAMSQYAFNLGASPTAVITAFADDFAEDATFDGQGTTGAITIATSGGNTTMDSSAWDTGLATATTDFIAANPGKDYSSIASPFSNTSESALSALALSQGVLSPSFATGTLTYAASVDNSITSLTVTPTAAHSGSTVVVNGTTVTSGTASGAISLSVGTNTILIVVDTLTTYTVTVTRASPNAGLNGITLSSGSLSPTFATATLSYTASVANGVTSITVTPTQEVSGSTITVNGTTVASGAASSGIALSEGANTLTLVVNNATTYTVTVTRAAAAGAELSDVLLSHGSFTSYFFGDTYDYSFEVDNAVASMTFTPIEATSGSTITVNGVTVASGTASGAISLTEGANVVTIIVNGGTTYTITVTRNPPPGPLNGIDLSAGSLSPGFRSWVLNYTTTIPYENATINVTPHAADSGSVITVNGTTVLSDAASDDLPLVVGPNVVTVVVDTTTYTFTVTRYHQLSVEARLSALTLSAGTLDPVFDPDTGTYVAEVPYGTTSLTITATVLDSTATLTIAGESTDSGVTSSGIALAVGDNPIEVISTAEDGSTLTYLVTVTRHIPEVIHDASLSSLVISAGTLSPAYNPYTVTTFTAGVPLRTSTIQITPTLTNPAASVKVQGVTVSSGAASSPIALDAKANTLTVVVTAEDTTTTTTYTLTINRSPSTVMVGVDHASWNTGNCESGWIATLDEDGNTITVSEAMVFNITDNSHGKFYPADSGCDGQITQLQIEPGTSGIGYNYQNLDQDSGILITAENVDGYVAPASVAYATVGYGMGAIAASEVGDTFCAVGGSSSIWCWGDNSYGQIRPLSDGFSWNGVAAVARPVSMDGWRMLTSKVTVGTSIVCSLLYEGKVQCRGRGDLGQLGNNATTDSSSPVYVKNSSNQTIYGVSDVDAGNEAACLIDHNGLVRCWGDNTNGLLGDGGSLSQIEYAMTVPLNDNTQWISVGADSACAVLIDHSAQCWGNNTHGQLGNNMSSGISAPVVVTDGTSPVIFDSAISVGDGTACGMSSGKMFCWGRNTYGQVGGSVASGTDSPIAVDSTLSSADGWVAVGKDNACAMHSGDVYCWGKGTDGQNALAGTTSTPTHITIPSAMNTVAISSKTTCAVGNTNIYCWGNNAKAAMGAVASTATPTLLPQAKYDPATAVVFTIGEEDKVTVGACTPIEITAVVNAGFPSYLQAADTVALSMAGTPDAAFYSDDACNDVITSTVIPKGKFFQRIYVKGNAAATVSATANSATLTDDTRNIIFLVR